MDDNSIYGMWIYSSIGVPTQLRLRGKATGINVTSDVPDLMGAIFIGLDSLALKVTGQHIHPCGKPRPHAVNCVTHAQT